uniref:Uncharacterized protein n=1 Tax=Anguilla anguilla TaxID=7936 RepID=A0A0E9VGH4_ANGAN
MQTEQTAFGNYWRVTSDRKERSFFSVSEVEQL